MVVVDFKKLKNFNVTIEIFRIIKVRHSLELDPVKGVSPSDVNFNSKIVTKILEQLTESIFGSAKKSPNALR
jgi:hypothetical protein